MLPLNAKSYKLLKVAFSRRSLSTSKKWFTYVAVDAETKRPILRTKVSVCGLLYQQWKERGWKRYKDAPKGGIVTDIEYYDNKYIVGNRTATNVLIFTGIPSSLVPFLPLIDHLTSLGVRTIIPKFPGFSLTKQSPHFRHSPQERVEVVKAVLEETGVNSVDLLLSHSSGVYTGVQMWKDAEPMVKSLGWLNPCTHEVVSYMRPYWLTRGLVKLYQTKFQQYVEKGATPLLKYLGNNFAKNGIDTLALGAFSLHYTSVYQFGEDLLDIREKEFPLLVLFSDNDRSIDKAMSERLVKALGGQFKDALIYDRDGHVVQKGNSSNWLQMVRFKSGGHFCSLKYPLLVNKAVENRLMSLKVVPELDLNAHNIPDIRQKACLAY